MSKPENKHSLTRKEKIKRRGVISLDKEALLKIRRYKKRQIDEDPRNILLLLIDLVDILKRGSENNSVNGDPVDNHLSDKTHKEIVKILDDNSP